jgi:LuxR family maltose regulon positive regulatory protein
MGHDIAMIADVHGASRQPTGPPASRGAGGVVPRPGLFERLGGPARVTMVSAGPGSGKTVLLRSWIAHAGLADRAAWVSAGRDERDPREFWLSVLNALRQTAPGSSLAQVPAQAQALAPPPDAAGCALPERLLTDLAPLRERLWLVIDDVHELGPEALRQLEQLVLRAPPQLRFVLASRHDIRLGLHRMRLDGELAEIRAADLRFTVAEARELFAAAGVELPESTVATLHQRTEGWAAGLRLAALSLAGDPDPERFAAGFSGTERTVAEYLLAEVLDRQPEEVRRLLLRTSILERVNGQLADLLTGDEGGERILQDLEQANAFVVSLDAGRTEFRYHQMFAELLALELRRTAPEEVAALHQAASAWCAAHGHPVEAVRHAQAVRDCGLAARLLAGHWPGLYLDGQGATAHELLAWFPAEMRGTDACLAAMTAADELAHGSVDAAQRYVGLAERGTPSMPDARRGQARLLLGITRLLLARQRGDRPAEAEEARLLETAAEAHDAAQPGLAKDLRVVTLTGLGRADYGTATGDEAEQRLQQGITLAQQSGRPFLQSAGLAHLAAVEVFRSPGRSAEHARQAIELAERHGWTDERPAGLACVVLGGLLAWQGRLAEAAPWIRRAERAVRAEAQPVAGMGVFLNRALLELGSGRRAEALADCRSFERLAGLLAAPDQVVMVMRAFQLQLLALLGQTEQAELALAGLADQERECGEIRVATAGLRLAQDDPHAAAAALAPVLDGSASLTWPAGLIQALLLEAIVRDTLGDPSAAGRALEKALDRAEPEGALLPFLLYPAPGLLARHTRHRTAHAALVSHIQDLLAGSSPAPPATPRPVESLSDSELRVLRYLPTNLTTPEIARDLCVSVNTIKTHLRNLYAKLGTHGRAEAVARARALSLLAPSGYPLPAHRRQSCPRSAFLSLKAPTN